MNPVAHESTLEQAYLMLIEAEGEITPEIEEMFAIVESQKEMALDYLVTRRVDRELSIAQKQGQIAWHKEQIEFQEKMIAKEQSVIKTADKWLIRLIETMRDSKGNPVSKAIVNGQEVKITQGTSNMVVVDDETAVPDVYKRAKVTIPADRLVYVKAVLSDDEVKSVKIEVDKAEIKKSPAQVPGTHIETVTTKHIKRMG